MRKNILALSIAAMAGGLGLVGGASAAVVAAAGTPVAVGPIGTPVTATNATTLEYNPGGTGHILTVPYFSTQNGNATLLNITNTDTVNAKAVKIRFRGASNSDDIFDFQLYLSPGDVWTANVSQGADGRSLLQTADNSCTIPANVNQPFVTARLSGTAAEQAAGTREGYIEIFNMADIPKTVGAAGVDTLYESIKHTSTGTVACGAVLEGLVATDLDTITAPAVTQEDEASRRGFSTPTSGLMAGWIIINVPEAAAYSGNAQAVEARVAAGGAAANGNIVFFPQTSTAPTSGLPAAFTADPGFLAPDGITILHEGNAFGVPGVGGVTTPAVAIANYDLPDLSTPYTGPVTPAAQASNLTSALAVSSITNEFLTEPGLAAATDWVFSMPTRRYSVVMDYRAGATTLNRRVFNSAVVNVGPAGVVGNRFFTQANTSVRGSQVCTKLATGAIAITDRSERTPAGGGFVISPGTGPTALTLCGETNVMSWNAGGVAGVSVLGATVARTDIDTAFRDGWARINTNPDDAADAGLLPAQGASFIKATNTGAASGVSGNFGVQFDHRFTR